jgi:hypothetical protein
VPDDPTVIKATMAKPGVVLRRPVGTSAPFTEHASLPRNFANVVEGPAKHRPSTSRQQAAPIDAKTAREAAAKYEREQKQRDRETRQEQAVRAKEQARHERAIAAAEQALEAASHAHKEKATELEEARATLDRKLEEENERWACSASGP